MKKLLKKILIISQVLGWSALLASACSDDAKSNNNSSTTASKSTDGAKNTKSDNPGAKVMNDANKTSDHNSQTTEESKTTSTTEDGKDESKAKDGASDSSSTSAHPNTVVSGEKTPTKVVAPEQPKLKLTFNEMLKFC